MRKIYIGALLLLLIVVGTVFYQQQQLIKDYRQSIYGDLAIIQKPIERILTFQETAEQYNDEQRAQLFEPLFNALADGFNYGGGGILHLEPHIKKQYYHEYMDAKTKYAVIVHAYMAATTSEEREQAHARLKEQYEAYEEFLKTAATELVEPF